MPERPAQHVLAVIPARYGSTRFPGKMLAPLAGKPLVVHAFEQTVRAKLVGEALVATDDQRIVDALKPLGIPTIMTRPDHRSGTDRIAEVAAQRNADVIVNVQGDEPLMDPATVDAVVEPLFRRSDVSMATARRRISDPGDIRNPNVVKVVCDGRGVALYFSRHPIPYVRDADDGGLNDTECHWQHLGIYAYRRDFLLRYAGWGQTPLEQLECLEQLRALEHGCRIAVVETQYDSVGVDTPEDISRVSALLESRGRRDHVNDA